MGGQTEKNLEIFSTKTDLEEKIVGYLEHCIECNRCMNICPVTKETFSIKELNTATEEETVVPKKIREFAFHCMQCGKCVPVCPVHIRRDAMVRYIKYKTKDKKPWGYRRYLFIKGPDLTGLKKITQRLYILVKKMTQKDLACFMETTPGTKADVLFYPGCYLYSTKTIRQTLRLLNHLGGSYALLGGLTACCGAPHLLQGELDEADHCAKLLTQKIKACNPKIIITACAECFEVVEQIKKMQKMDYEVLSVTQYLLQFPEMFPANKIRGKTLVHDSCRFHEKSAQGAAARNAVSRFTDLVTPPPTQPSSCCYQWNHGTDPNNAARQHTYMKSVGTRAKTLAFNCLTCYEELQKMYTDVEIIDILQLFEESLDAAKTSEQTSE
jgi:Fe-S oxidoreductase